MVSDERNVNDSATMVAERIMKAFEQPVSAAGEIIFVHLSIGIATTHDSHDADELIRNADLAMYRAKESGKGRYEMFDPWMRDAVLKRHGLKEELQRAVERGQLIVEYQPIVSLETGDGERRRGARALEPPRPRTAAAVGVRPARGGDRNDHRPRPVRARGGLLQRPWLAGRGTRGRRDRRAREPLGGRAARSQPPGHGRRPRWSTRAWTPSCWCWRSPRACSRTPNPARPRCARCGARRAAGTRRLRHGLLVAQLPA